MPELQLAGLKVHVRPATAGGPKPNSAVVLLHGYGAPGTDLVSVADELCTPEGTLLLIPEGPFELSSSSGDEQVKARGWWQTNEGRLHLARLTGQVQLAARGATEGVQCGRHVVMALLDAIQAEFNLGSERIVLGGFSQGAIACLDTLLHDSRRLAGLIYMSGTTDNIDESQHLARQRTGMPALLSHGTLDPVLPYVVAENLQAQLGIAGWNVTWVPFAGSHNIPGEVLQAISIVLARWLA